MMRCLEVPFVFSSCGIQCKDRNRIQVAARSIAAIKTSTRISNWKEDNTALRIDGDQAPQTGTPTIFPTRSPGIVVWFARLRYGVKSPHELAGLDIKCLRIARRTN